MMNNGPNSGSKALNQAEGLARLLSRPLVVLTRRDFGERFFGASAFGKLLLYGVLLFAAVSASQHLDTLPLGGFLLLSFAACLWHQFVIWRRNYRGEEWHSYYSGTPWLAEVLPLDEFKIKQWIEPILWTALGTALLELSPALGCWLLFSGACLGATATLTAARERTKLLDMMDAQIEAKNMRAALIERKPATETQGFVISVGGMKPQQRETLFNRFTSLYDRAREAITTQHTQTGRCAVCSAWNIADAGYCGNCGGPLAASVEEAASIQPSQWRATG